MKIGLFIPCYVDQMFPNIGLATVQILRQFPGIELDYPEDQTCCGQPMANTGCVDQTRPLARRFVELFSDFDHVVCPSGSCVSMVKHHYAAFFHRDSRFDRLRDRIWELCEFLSDVLEVQSMPHAFPYRVGLHSSCHGLRELRLDPCSERMGPQSSKVRRILEMVPGIQLVDLCRGDECCGFGGTFAVAEEGVSVMMGRDRIADHLRAGAEYITATDASCLMHLDGLIRREKQKVKTVHVAEILAGYTPNGPAEAV
jgi:L-lactate dehydrogenase complex protein LldE